MKIVFLCAPKDSCMEKTCKYLILQGDYLPLSPSTYFDRFVKEEDFEDKEYLSNLGIELIKSCHELWVIGNELTENMKYELNFVYEEVDWPIKIVFKTWEEVGVEEWTKQKTMQDSLANAQELDLFTADFGTTDT